MRDPLHSLQPHTPDKPFRPDPNRPTCSAPSEGNKGCASFAMCGMTQLRGEMSGPAQLVLEDHRDVDRGDGRRFGIWCFEAFRMFFGASPKPGYSICEDRAVPVLNGTKWDVSVLPEYDKQGPYPYPPESRSSEGAVEAMRKFRAKGKTGGAQVAP